MPRLVRDLAELARVFGNEERLNALLAVLASEEAVSSSLAWSENLSTSMRTALLRDLRPFLRITKTRRDSLYSIDPEWRDLLERLVACLEEGVAMLEDDSPPKL